jgi:predicted nicotinamide N-methyase
MADPADQSLLPASSSRRQRLLARIHRSYVTTTQPVRLGKLSFAFTRIADPDRVLDQVVDEADRRERLSGNRERDEHLHLPYWAELWDSAFGIGQFLVRSTDAQTRERRDAAIETGTGTVVCPASLRASPPHVPLVPAPPCLGVSASSCAVLDLGCGMGLSGTVAAALGARVLFADIEPPALLFARLNSHPWAPRVRTRRLNWRTDRLEERFDLILGADILYERAQWEHQEPFLLHHLAPGGAVLLGEPGRQTGDLFIDWIKARGWGLEIVPEKVPTRETPIRIFRLTRSPD